LVKLGDGTLTLAPSASNAYTGGTVLKQGTLRVASVAMLGSNTRVAGQNTNTVNPGTATPLIFDGGTLSFSATTALGTRPIVFYKGGGTISVDGGATVTFDDSTHGYTF